MRVSVCINNFNYEKYLREAIDSGLNQTHDDVEIVVVDDGSTDSSRDIIASYGDRIKAVLKPNGGQGSTFNAGFAAATGDVICLLDADDTFTPDKCKRVAGVCSADPEVGWVFHLMQVHNIKTGEMRPLRRKGPTRRIDFREMIKAGKHPGFVPATSALCFTRKCLSQILPMPEEGGTSADRFLKPMALALAPGYFLDEPLCVQKIHGENAFSHQPQKVRTGAKSYVLTSHWIRQRLPWLKNFTNKTFSMGVGTYNRTGGVDPQYRPVVDEYMRQTPLLERIEIRARAYYHSSKLTEVYRNWKKSRYTGEMAES
jgi:glycosyltransferase involved in cell wall biosynthesis